MGEKTVNELAGIGEVMGKRLAAKGKIHNTFFIYALDFSEIEEKRMTKLNLK